jgi:hypothetical protein
MVSPPRTTDRVDLRDGRRGAIGRARRSDIITLARRIPPQGRASAQIGRMMVALKRIKYVPRNIEGSLSARMERVRQSGYADGGREAKLMLLLSETVSELSYRPAQHRTRRRPRRSVRSARD